MSICLLQLNSGNLRESLPRAPVRCGGLGRCARIASVRSCARAEHEREAVVGGRGSAAAPMICAPSLLGGLVGQGAIKQLSDRVKKLGGPILAPPTALSQSCALNPTSVVAVQASIQASHFLTEGSEESTIRNVLPEITAVGGQAVSVGLAQLRTRGFVHSVRFTAWLTSVGQRSTVRGVDAEIRIRPPSAARASPDGVRCNAP